MLAPRTIGPAPIAIPKGGLGVRPWGMPDASGAGPQGLDPFSLLAYALMQGRQQTPGPALYDPTMRIVTPPVFGAPPVTLPSDLLQYQSLQQKAGLAGSEAAIQAGRVPLQTRLDALTQQLAGLPQAPVRTYAPFEPTPPPDRAQVPYPTPTEPRLDPISSGAMLLASLIAPKYGGQFMAAGLGGIKTQADEATAEGIKTWQAQKGLADQAYADKMAAWDVANRAREANLRGGETAAYDTAQGQYAGALARAPIAGELAGLRSQLAPGGPMSLLEQSQREADLLNAAATGVGQRISFGLSQNQSLADRAKEQRQYELDVMKAQMPLRTATVNAAQRDLASQRSYRLGVGNLREMAAYHKGELGARQGELNLRASEVALKGLEDGMVRAPNGVWRYDPQVAALMQTNDSLKQQRLSDMQSLRGAQQNYRTVVAQWNAEQGRVLSELRKVNPTATLEEQRAALNASESLRNLDQQRRQASDDLHFWTETAAGRVMSGENPPAVGGKTLPGLPGTKSIKSQKRAVPNEAQRSRVRQTYDPVTGTYR